MQVEINLVTDNLFCVVIIFQSNVIPNLLFTYNIQKILLWYHAQKKKSLHGVKRLNSTLLVFFSHDI